MQRLVLIGSLLFFTLVTGIWLGALGKPFNAPLSLFHKLLAIAWVIFSSISIYHAVKLHETGIAHLAVIAVLAISTVALFATGAQLTRPNLESPAWLALHRIASATVAIAAVITVRLFNFSHH